MSSHVERFEAAGVRWISTPLSNGDVEIEPADNQPVLVVLEAHGEARLECYRARRQQARTREAARFEESIAVDVSIKRFPNLKSALAVASRVLANDPAMAAG